jgi:hypothetical protein
MEQHRCAVISDALTRPPSRRGVLRGLAAAGLALRQARLPGGAAAKKKRKKKRRKDKDQGPTGPLCTSLGEACAAPGIDCQERFCLQDSFIIEAIWAESGSNHQTTLFVPLADGRTGPFPFINYDCRPDTSACAVEYPFACVDRNATGPGHEVTTVYDRLPGAYEYWIGLDSPAPAGELTIVLSDRSDRVVRAWANPASTTMGFVGWHVFDVDATHAINGAPDVCPYAALGRQARDRTATRVESNRPEPVKENN